MDVAEAVKAFEDRVLRSNVHNAPEMLDAFRYLFRVSLGLPLLFSSMLSSVPTAFEIACYNSADAICPPTPP